MEDKEDSEPTIQNNKLTCPLLLSVLGSNLAFLDYGYSYYLISSPVLKQMQWIKLEGANISSLYLEFMLLMSVILVPLGGLLGVFLWGCLADQCGRKSAILIGNGLSIFLSAILCLDKIVRSFEFSVFARFFVGIVTGIFTYSVPLYILEISSLTLRGAFVSTSILFYNWGFLLVQILASPQIWGNEENYALLVGIIAVLAIMSSALLMYSPESPRFLYLQRNEEEKARQVLKTLRGEEDVEEQMEELRQEHLDESGQKKMTLWRFLHHCSYRWHIVTILISISGSQFLETRAVLFFAQESYKALGLSNKAMKLVPVMGSLIIQLMLLTAICTVDALGRRFLLLNGFLMCSLANFALVFTLQIGNPAGAFISVILVILFFMGHVTGPGSILLLVIGELFLQSSRASAFVFAGLTSWGSNFILAILFPLTSPSLGSYYLLIYCPFIVLTNVYIFRVAPETTGKTFQETQKNMRAWNCKTSRKVMAE